VPISGGEGLQKQLQDLLKSKADEARVEEIARMLGGVEITAITRQHAKEMLSIP